jgi:hypothetical protein
MLNVFGDDEGTNTDEYEVKKDVVDVIMFSSSWLLIVIAMDVGVVN